VVKELLGNEALSITQTCPPLVRQFFDGFFQIGLFSPSATEFEGCSKSFIMISPFD